MSPATGSSELTHEYVAQRVETSTSAIAAANNSVMYEIEKLNTRIAAAGVGARPSPKVSATNATPSNAAADI